MTEQEYINLSALKDIRIAKNHISEVVTPMVPCIPDQEKQLVMQILNKWVDALQQEIKIDHD